VEEIRKADLIIVGPGSLYTSILPNLLVPKIGEAVCESDAKKVYICNVMTQAGETLDYTASDHVKALYDHLGCPFMDTILVNEEDIPEEIKFRYKKEYATPVVYDIAKLSEMGLKIVHDKIIRYEDGYIRHDTQKVAALLYSMIKQEK